MAMFDQWQGVLVGVISLVVTALVARWVRRRFDARLARKREAAKPASSRQVRRAQERRKR